MAEDGCTETNWEEITAWRASDDKPDQLEGTQDPAHTSRRPSRASAPLSKSNTREQGNWICWRGRDCFVQNRQAGSAAHRTRAALVGAKAPARNADPSTRAHPTSW